MLKERLLQDIGITAAIQINLLFYRAKGHREMTISELREILKQCKEDDIKLLAVELYKAMPKKLKEEKEIDQMIKDIVAGERNKRSSKQSSKKVTAEELRGEIELFLENAYAQNYFAPNRSIPKKERPKWRFKVKAYIKDLSSISGEGEDGKLAAQLLEKLYKMLCYGCQYYIFNTEDTFYSIGMEQKTLLDLVIKKNFENGIDRESISRMVSIATGMGVSRNTLYSSLLVVLVSNLKTTDSREIAIEEAKAQSGKLDKEWHSLSQKKSSWWNMDSYERKENIEHLTELIFRLFVNLCEYDEGIDYYKKHIQNVNNEVNLYCLLQLLFEYDLKDYWMREYEAAVKKKVAPRESLQRVYTYIKDNGEFPEHYYY